MSIGGSLLLIAIGAILAFAVNAHVSGIDINTVGVILMIIGLGALCFSWYWLTSRRRTDVIYRDADGVQRGTTYLTPNDPVDGPY